MQVTTLGTISPQVNTSFLPNEFSKISRSLERKGNSTSLQPFINFRGQISVGEFSIPIQRFSLRAKDNFVFIENFPTASFPKVEITLEEASSIYNVKEFKVRPSDNTVHGEILYTRFFLLTANANNCSLNFRDIDFPPFNFSFSDMILEEKKRMIFRAKLFRKLGFLEECFNTKLTVPENITPNDSRQIETLFRGITEGEFTTPVASSITVFNYKLKSEDLESLTVSQKKSFSFELNEDLLVLGKFFPVGKTTFRIDKAAIANQRSLRSHKVGDVVEQLRFSVFDYQVHHSYLKYLNKERLLRNKQKFEHFKKSLLQDESEFLVNLLDEPLAEIDDKASIEIVTGWLQYYDFPDRYTVGEPVLDDENWRVPILLTYPKEKSIWIEDAFVDSKTGIIEISSSVEQLRKKGKKKALEVFSVV